MLTATYVLIEHMTFFIDADPFPGLARIISQTWLAEARFETSDGFEFG
jgi:hypothetical protein